MSKPVFQPDLDNLPRTSCLTIKQVAQVTGFSVPTLNRWKADGRPPKVTYLNGRPRYRVGDVLDWMSQGEA